MTMKLLLYKKGLPVAIGCIRNISRRGLFVETDCVDIHAHQLLEVELLPRTSEPVDRCRFHTRVVRRSAQGIGLEVDEHNAAGGRVLGALMRSPR
jgi:hypothetical protein